MIITLYYADCLEILPTLETHSVDLILTDLPYGRVAYEDTTIDFNLLWKDYKRIIFRIWPGRGAPIESTFKQELIQELKTVDPGYADWMISINYEIEKERIK